MQGRDLRMLLHSAWFNALAEVRAASLSVATARRFVCVHEEVVRNGGIVSSDIYAAVGRGTG